MGDEVSKEICMLKKISVDYGTPLNVMNTVIVLKKKRLRHRILALAQVHILCTGLT